MPDVPAVGQQVLANEIGADGRAALRRKKNNNMVVRVDWIFLFGDFSAYSTSLLHDRNSAEQLDRSSLKYRSSTLSTSPSIFN